MQASSVIAVFAKPPIPGRVKTRLQGVLSPARAALLHRACVEDTVAFVCAVPGCEKWLLAAGTPEDASVLAQDLQLSSDWNCGTQQGRDLGARMHNALRVFFGTGATKVVIVGTDTPWMTPQRMRHALRVLDSADVVLGPAADGGYYLVGARRLEPAMFRGIPWGRSGVLAATLLALAKKRIRYRLLPRDFDLDRPDDLERAAILLREHPERAPALAAQLGKRIGTMAEVKSEQRKASGSSLLPAPARPHKKRRPGRA